MPAHIKVTGKEWAEARRTDNISKLSMALIPALEGRQSFTFELGCGHGHWLAAYAAAHPAEFCLGIDLITHRVERSRRKQTRAQLNNLLFLKAEATEFLEALPQQAFLGKVFILYPDPWPKKKHHKNRFINGANLTLLASRATKGTRLHFRTDNSEYFQWSHAHITRHKDWQLLPQTTWPFEQMTFFEARMKGRLDLFAERI